MLPPIHPTRVAAAFAPPLPPPVARQLLDHPRFADRIALLLGPLDLPDDVDTALVMQGREGLERLATCAGAVLHARRFLREIRGPVIADLATRLGEDALAVARAHADLAWSREGPADVDAFATTVAADGAACLGAWITECGGSAPLLWPDDDSVPRTDDPEIRTLGPQIVRRLQGTA